MTRCHTFDTAYCWVSRGYLWLWDNPECYLKAKMPWKFNSSASRNISAWTRLRLHVSLILVQGISFLLSTRRFPQAGTRPSCSCCPSQGSRNAACTLLLASRKPPTSSACPGSGTCLTHLGHCVSLLRAPLPELSCSRPSFKPHDRNFIKEGYGHLIFVPLKSRK